LQMVHGATVKEQHLVQMQRLPRGNNAGIVAHEGVTPGKYTHDLRLSTDLKTASCNISIRRSSSQ
jgi:hypothetical protein